MSISPNNQGHKKMRRAVRLRERRSERWKKEGERSLWQNLSMVGALGWLIVTPTLLGVLVGRWLDGLFDTGIFFSGALIFLGIAIGSYLAWQRVTKE
ncbi:MAG: AtpZ/AtpI family protein [Rhodospirillales bacterium]|nr:AtpZ/AtpI family protein [Rhodospirillales bacterium]MDH3966970.1 AtpZ/AtpI family protein [Rhodospirillales bacterium]